MLIGSIGLLSRLPRAATGPGDERIGTRGCRSPYGDLRTWIIRIDYPITPYQPDQGDYPSRSRDLRNSSGRSRCRALGLHLDTRDPNYEDPRARKRCHSEDRRHRHQGRVQNLNIEDKQGQAHVTGEGHVHFYMDVTLVPSVSGQPAIPADLSALWAHVSNDEQTFANVSPGTRTIVAQLVNNDLTPVVSTVFDMVTVSLTT